VRIQIRRNYADLDINLHNALKDSVLNPYSFDPDPDPAFYAEYPLYPIRIQGFDDQK
jgi:hypothetical protein